ncbi:MAG: DUF3108 domain-containing protein [Ignavibacteriales bacterium]|nr:DUF3108 domain-containing protein [Ignavibacteriales bacterium]
MNSHCEVLRGFRILILVIPTLFSSLFGQENTEKAPFSHGEVLQYKVKWNFIRLGTVIVHQEQLPMGNTEKYLVRMDVRSAAGLPFINVNFINEAVLQKDVPSLEYVRVISGDDPTIFSTFVHDRSREILIATDSAQGTCLRSDSMRWNGFLYDALSLFMATRVLSGGRAKITLPTLNDYQIAPTEVVFTGEEEELEVPAFDREIRCRYVQGIAKWEGKTFAGMTGAFQGWLTDDEAALPVRAEVKIFLGSIVLELESYRRMNWSPGTMFRHASLD